ncbi:tyrosine/DOPA decarboxylase [Spatholobus suberectus]|nr:tyrosine/DOPA decarboxylase [Spatholobus suberectus]
MQPIEVGSVSSLYKSVENLDKECLCTDTCKEMLLRPRSSMEAYCKSLKLNIDDTEPTEYFVCSNLIRCRYGSTVLISTFNNKRCICGNMLDKAISPQTTDVFDGFVKSNATFMITDDLKILPNSLDTFFYLFKNSGLENMSSVSEMTVTITKNQIRFIFFTGGMVHLMEGCSSMGSVDGLYKGIVDLDENYWTTKEVKKKLVEPGLAPQFILSNQLLPIHDGSKYFCYTEHRYRVDLESYLTAWYLTPKFGQSKSSQETCTALDFFDLKSETGNSKGYAKGPTMYMATDDLAVTPMSPISVVSLLTSMSIPFSDLEEKEVSIGIKEGASILQASLTSTSALTTGLRHNRC